MQKKIKEFSKKYLIGFTLGLISAGIVVVYAETYFPSNQTTYDNSASGMQATDVQGAIDELYNTCFPPSGGDTILDNTDIVTSGDGLYKDEYEDGRYLYRGANPNNYIKFNNELWRIISLEKDGTIKIRRNDYFMHSYDEYGNRTTLDDSYYCRIANSNGCNIWGSINSMKNQNGESITQIYRSPLSPDKLYTLPSKNAILNDYLNNDYYNQLTGEAQNQIVARNFDAGLVSKQSGQTLETDLNQSKTYLWNGKIALINVTEYVRATTDNKCTTAYNYYNDDYCHNVDNWMFANVSPGEESEFFTMTPYPYSSSSNAVTWVWSVSHYYLRSIDLEYGAVWPTLYLSSSVQITGGDGSQSNPYTIE